MWKDQKRFAGALMPSGHFISLNLRPEMVYCSVHSRSACPRGGPASGVHLLTIPAVNPARREYERARLEVPAEPRK